MGFVAAIKSCLSKYATFGGRASRAEYWYFSLFATLVHIAATLLDSALGTEFQTQGRFATDGGYIDLLCDLVLFLPSISVQVRRLHDRDRSAHWLWLYAVPLIGWVWIIIWNTRHGTEGPNRFGLDPLASSAPPGGVWPIAAAQ